MGSQLENIGLALQGFGAGIQGQLPQFNQMLQNRDLMQQQKQEAAQKLEAERMKTMYTAAKTALGLLDSENYEGLVQFGVQRIGVLQQLGADPSDTQRLTQLAVAAKNGSDEAKDLLRKELATTVQIGEGMGIIPAEKKSSKVVGDYLVDDETGKVIFDASKEGPRERATDQNGVLRYIDTGEAVFPQVEKVEQTLSGKDKIDQAAKLRAEIANANKDFTQISGSWDRIAASAQEPSAAGDLALIFNYMKMLDPGSTVREGEFANAQNAGGIPDRIRALYNRASNGERLTQKQRDDFLGQAQRIFQASRERADQITNEFVRIGGKYDIPADEILIDKGASPGYESKSDYPTVTSQKDFDSLPSGALFLEDGILYRKP